MKAKPQIQLAIEPRFWRSKTNLVKCHGQVEKQCFFIIKDRPISSQGVVVLAGSQQCISVHVSRLSGDVTSLWVDVVIIVQRWSHKRGNHWELPLSPEKRLSESASEVSRSPPRRWYVCSHVCRYASRPYSFWYIQDCSSQKVYAKLKQEPLKLGWRSDIESLTLVMSRIVGALAQNQKFKFAYYDG